MAKPAVPTVLVLTQTLGYHHMSIPAAMAWLMGRSSHARISDFWIRTARGC